MFRMQSKFWCLLAAALCCTAVVQAQWVVSDPTNLAQGIVNSSNQIVQNAKTTQGMLQTFAETQKIYRQGREYYDKLRAVNDLVRSARKVQECILMVGDMSDLYVSNYGKMLSDENFSPEELATIASGYTQLLQRGANSLKDLQGIINPSTLSLTDKDRLDVVDKSHAELTHLRDLTAYFTRKMRSVALIRAYEKNEKKRALSLYGTDEEKYW